MTITGWRVGIQSISFILLLKEKCGLSLRAGRDALDRLLEGRSLEFDFKTEQDAVEFCSEASRLGAICRNE